MAECMFKHIPSNYLHCECYNENSDLCNHDPGFKCKKYLELWTELQRL